MNPDEPTQRSSPRLTIVVVIFNMRREAPRTLYSLSADYQSGTSPRDYEVVCVENGSTEPLSPHEVEQFGANFRYLRIDHASPSPADAINRAVAQSNARYVGIMVDGARIASPGVVGLALEALEGFHPAVVGTIAFHLGPDMQTRSPARGYSRSAEDRLLAGIEWRNNGYRLFECSTPAGSSKSGWWEPIAESNLVFLPRDLFDELHGFDERFDLPGGGFVNGDFYRRACELENTALITLLGEATFHQMHGGVAANRPERELGELLRAYDEQYRSIRGVPFEASKRVPMLIGSIRPDMLRSLASTFGVATRRKSLWRRASRYLRRSLRRVMGR